MDHLTFDREHPNKLFIDNPHFEPSEFPAMVITNIIREGESDFSVISYLGHESRAFQCDDLTSGHVTVIQSHDDCSYIVLNNGTEKDDVIIIADDTIIMTLSQITGFDPATFVHQSAKPTISTE